MKRIILSIATLLFAMSINAQTFTADQLEKYAKDKYGSNWAKAAENLKNEVALDNENRLNYQEIIECPEQSKEQLFAKALKWFEKTFKTQDTKGTIIEQDEENGLIVAKAHIEKVAVQSAGVNRYQVDLAPYIRVDLKEERARISAYAGNYEVKVSKGGGTTSTIGAFAAVAAMVAVVAATSDNDKSDSNDKKETTSSSSSSSKSETTSSSSSKSSTSSTSSDSSKDAKDDDKIEYWDINSCYPFIEKDRHKKASSKAFVMTSAFQNSIIDILKEALLADNTSSFDDDW